MSTKFKRIFAFIIDWNLMLLPFFAIWQVIPFIAKKLPSADFLVFIFAVLVFVSALASVVLRDAVFKGRSLGKRLFGLYVCEKGTVKQANTGKKIIRNIFFFFCYVDVFLLLATGETIGDKVTNTVVYSKKELDLRKDAESAEECEKK